MSINKYKERLNKQTYKELERILEKSKLVGYPGAHPREDILNKQKKFVKKTNEGKKTTNGLQFPDTDKINMETVKESVKKFTGINENLSDSDQKAWVTQEKFISYLCEAVDFSLEILNNNGTVILGTGHASLYRPYAYIADLLREKGAEIYYSKMHEAPAEFPSCWIGNLNGVIILFGKQKAREKKKQIEFKHTHSDEILKLVWEKENLNPDLVLGDHGFAGFAINKKVPTIAITDTNDIDLLVAAQKYPERVFPIPMHDNPGAEAGLDLGYCFEIVLKYRLANYETGSVFADEK